MAQGKVVIEAELDTKSFEAQIDQLTDKLDTLQQEYESALKSGVMPEDELKKYASEIEQTENKIVSLKQKQDELNQEGFSNVQSSIKNIGNSMENVIGKVVRWGLAIFGIRSAYMLVRNAIATITSDDEQLKADIDYMKNVLAYMLEPVVRAIVNLMKQLMFYVGYIAKAWFGVDIYAKASAKAMQAGTKSAKATTKELNKQLAKFDEMNVLQSGSGGGGDSGGGGTPSFDLGNMGDMKVPGWLEWIGKHGKELIPILAGIASGIMAVYLGSSLLQGLGIAIAVWGIVSAVQELLEYLKDPKWEKFANTVTYIGIAIMGLAIAFQSLPLAVAGVAIAITGLVVKYWNEVKDTFNEKIKELEKSVDDVKKKWGYTIGDIYEGVVKFLRETYNTIDNHIKGVKLLFDGVIEFFKGIFKKNWEDAYKGLEKIAQGSLNIIVGAWNQTIGLIISAGRNLGQAMGNVMSDMIKQAINGVMWVVETTINGWISQINGVISLLNKLPGVKMTKVGNVKLPRLAQGGIVNNPGPGVMMGSYVAGERGAEAILPLTDDTLQRLANMIPITVNLTNTMNGRVISRELVKTQNEQNFAFNR